MKSKLKGVLPLGLALVLTFSLMGAFLQANHEAEAQGITPNRWQTVPIPAPGPPGYLLFPGSNITDFVVAGDGRTSYAINAGADWIYIRTTTLCTVVTGVITITYTDQDGTAANAGTTVLIPLNTPAGTEFAVTLAGTDTGVIAVTAVADAAAGVVNFDIIGGKTGHVFADFVATAGADTFNAHEQFAAANAVLLKSIDGGRTFSLTSGMPAAAATLKLVAVAPDDPDFVAVVDTDTTGNVVWLSTDGGAAWSSLLPTPWAGTEIVTDIAISPARAAAFLGRDIVVTTSDLKAVFTGEIYHIGDTLTWSPNAAAAGIPAALGANLDYTSLALAPAWTGDLCVVAIGSGPLATSGGTAEAGVTAGDTFMVVLNLGTVTTIATTRLDTASTDSPGEMDWAIPRGITSSDVALPSDWDSTSPAMRQAYVGWASMTVANVIVNGDDAYRVDSNMVRKLGIAAAIGIYSIDFFGTVSSGSLIAGETRSTQVYFTSEATATMPTWVYSLNPPTGVTSCIVQYKPDSSDEAFAGTTGLSSAFSFSEDGGLTWDQISLIDEAVVGAGVIRNLRDVMPAPDGSCVFLATDDGTNASLWQSPIPPSINTWERVDYRAGWATSIIRLSPDYIRDSTVYWFDAGGTGIRRYNGNSDTWDTRKAPANVTDATVESKDVLYTISAGNVYKSTNGAFELPTDAGIGNLATIAMAPSYPEKPVEGNMLVGGTNSGVAYSTDGGETFVLLLEGILGTTNVQVLGCKGYANNGIIYAASGNVIPTVGPGIFRYKIGVSTAWENIRSFPTTPNSFTGLATYCGMLYGAWTMGGTAPSGTERTLNPTEPMSVMEWDSMTIGAEAAIFNRAPSSLRACGNDTEVWLYAIDVNMPATTDALLAYHDTMPKAAAKVRVPVKVPYDPNTQGNAQFTIAWNRISNATQYHAEIYSDAGCTQFVTSAGMPVGTNAPYTPANLAAPAWVVGAGALSAGQDYYFRVRACNQVLGGAIRSQWSGVVKFNIEAGAPISATYPGPQILTPTPGASHIDLSQAFSWGAVYGAVKYEFELSTSPEVTARGYFIDPLVELTGARFLTSTACECDITLDYSTNYYWHVKAITRTGETPWSTGTFTTMAEEEVQAPTTPQVELPAPVTPGWVYAIFGIDAVGVIVAIVLIARTRRPS